VFAEIAQRLRRSLPTAVICNAPTIAALADLLETPELPRFSPFVPLKAGNKNPPILIGHGVGGRASFSELAKHIRTENPIYGIQAKGVDGMEQPLHSIENMADYYLRALPDVQRQGPYILIGYSFGGLIALEMAQRLLAAGKRVALLAMIDTYPHPRYLPRPERWRLGMKRVKGHFENLTRKPLRDAVSQVTEGIKHRVHRSGVKNSSSPAEKPGLSFAETTLRVKQYDFSAMRLYRPQFYPGKINFVRPETNAYLPSDPTVVWKKLTAEFQVETVPGDHLGMIGTYFKSLASVLTRLVDEALHE
jgi:acetoacetyl-CoA synthetase